MRQLQTETPLPTHPLNLAPPPVGKESSSQEKLHCMLSHKETDCEDVIHQVSPIYMSVCTLDLRQKAEKGIMYMYISRGSHRNHVLYKQPIPSTVA